MAGKMPWDRDSLREWAIVGMNHYRMSGARRLFVAMTRGSQCIVAEGEDEQAVFDSLNQQAAALHGAGGGE